MAAAAPASGVAGAAESVRRAFAGLESSEEEQMLMEGYCEAIKKQYIYPKVLANMTDEELSSVLGMEAFGHRAILRQFLASQPAQMVAAAPQAAAPGTSGRAPPPFRSPILKAGQKRRMGRQAGPGAARTPTTPASEAGLVAGEEVAKLVKEVNQAKDLRAVEALMRAHMGLAAVQEAGCHRINKLAAWNKAEFALWKFGIHLYFGHPFVSRNSGSWQTSNGASRSMPAARQSRLWHAK